MTFFEEPPLLLCDSGSPGVALCECKTQLWNERPNKCCALSWRLFCL